MILKLSIFGLVLVLIAVIAIQYYKAKETFDDLNACAGIPDTTLINDVPLNCAQELFLLAGCTTNGKDYPADLTSEWYTAKQRLPMTIAKYKEAVNALKNSPTMQSDPKFKIGCYGSVDAAPSVSIPKLTGACMGLSRNMPVEEVPLPCMQQVWKENMGCSENSIAYPMDKTHILYTNPAAKTLGSTIDAANFIKKDEKYQSDPSFRKTCYESPANGASTAPVAPAVAAAAPAVAASVLAPAASPQFNEVKPEVSVSDTGYVAMQAKQKSDLLSNIQKIVRNELLANRMTEPTIPTKKRDEYDNTVDDSHCTAQGSEFKKATPKRMSKGCPDNSDPYDDSDQPKDSVPKPYKSHMPDMSKYIKKDSIPCWGCSLDY
uniref:Uncharacterized protein n=1 Tax=viral metagenome TaxID=1070528 RepID=A0A6C0KS63_9ZZZZ